MVGVKLRWEAGTPAAPRVDFSRSSVYHGTVKKRNAKPLFFFLACAAAAFFSLSALCALPHDEAAHTDEECFVCAYIAQGRAPDSEALRSAALFCAALASIFFCRPPLSSVQSSLVHLKVKLTV
ncbi:MAG: hypothetical protein LBC67_00300 [Spirochaetales bacterium]|jgi:hypothetical protein|nr:hypothetical protein [Spirochaetales bacterium]